MSEHIFAPNEDYCLYIRTEDMASDWLITNLSTVMINSCKVIGSRILCKLALSHVSHLLVQTCPISTGQAKSVRLEI